MNIKVNGKDINFSGITIRDLIDEYKINPKNIVIEKNMKIIHKEKYMNEKLSQGDIVELVSFVGGG